MTEPAAGEPGSAGPAGTPIHCPWCSTAMPPGAARCPSCGAAVGDVVGGESTDIPGVTQVDPVVGMRRQAARPNRLVGWLADIDSEPEPAPGLRSRDSVSLGGAQGLEGAGPGSVAPPSAEVRREMARLELEALQAELAARAAAPGPADNAADSADAPPEAGDDANH